MSSTSALRSSREQMLCVRDERACVPMPHLIQWTASFPFPERRLGERTPQRPRGHAEDHETVSGDWSVPRSQQATPRAGALHGLPRSPVGLHRRRAVLHRLHGLRPNNKITGGKVRSSRSTPSANRAATALRLAANSLHRSDSALGAFLRRKKAQLGAPKAITATAHKLARLVYSMLKYGQEYVDAGQDYYESQYRQRALRAATRRAGQLGYKLVPIPIHSTTPAVT